MVQNLKVDIIYHLSPSDFEMEFNLSGRCRMRLLSDKTSDKKGFIKALARDVARSRVIIACGPLFGADGLISTVATAIGSGTAACDSKTYGINSDEPIHIISGSTPLVTPDGYFGGCIIESGPQTIILLTENKTFRKSIMQNLIHPYIEEISYIPVATASPIAPPAADPEPIFETAVSEQENYLTEPDDYDPTSEQDISAAQPIADEHNIEFIMDQKTVATDTDEPAQEAAPIFDDAYNIMYTEIEKPEDINSRYSQPYKPSESDQMFIAERETDDKTAKKGRSDTHGMDIAIIILILLLLLSVLALVYFIVLRPMTMGVSTGDYLKEIFGMASQNTLV